MSPLLIVLAVLTFSLMVAGLVLFVRSISTKDPFRIPKFLLIVPVLVLIMGALSQQEKAAAPAPTPPTGEVASFITPPPAGEKLPPEVVEQSGDVPLPPAGSMPSDDQTEEVAPEPAPATSERTPAQNLAIIAGRDPNDSEVASKFAYLDSLCPENGAKVGDIVVNLQQLVESNSGRALDIVYAMDQLATAQEGGVQAGNMQCVETAALLSVMLEKE